MNSYTQLLNYIKTLGDADIFVNTITKTGEVDLDQYKGNVFPILDISIVNGALIFFLNLSKELRTSIQKYSTAQELVKGSKHQIFGLNGDGMQPS